MAARVVVINELLYFVNNNVELIDNETFINNISDFYTNEDIITATKLLKSDIENLKLDNNDKLQMHGNTKKDKLLECLSLFKYLKTNNMLDKCSIFVSYNMVKIPKLESIANLNFVNLKNEIRDIVHSQLVRLNNIIETNKHDIQVLKNKTSLLSNINVENNCKTANSENIKPTVLPNIPFANSTVQLGKPLWSDISRTPTEDSSFTLVTRKNKRPRALTSDTDNNNIEADTNSNKRSAPKIIGKKEVDCKLKADKVLYNKRVYSMSNIQKCSASDVSEFLSSCGINVLSCYPVFKNTEPSKFPTPTETTKIHQCFVSALTK
ncbi:hypothetical protein HELRODRAFT_172491 [Helobdella robusta]|uniref:Uncharacterized protein n=1 Tax=Helobdella robusta TaxID=6412 RepID=T1F5E3_HELRO|nr:hypothetical protein HELRODRAFT_172491 [Helobdella robusta]ESO04816.1 hypothetical protein HELRODRAFT_172491 [Helobdella robusta]